jgi:outer membrane murein-binding lipoprotein Lpp
MAFMCLCHCLLAFGCISGRYLQAVDNRLYDERRQLQEWGSRLAMLTADFDAAKEEVKAARTDIEAQRALLAQQVLPWQHFLAAVVTCQKQVDEPWLATTAQAQGSQWTADAHCLITLEQQWMLF